MDLEGFEVFVDPMVLHGVLSGVLLGLSALWLLVLRSALWRAWLRQQHGGALLVAQQRLGLTPSDVRLRPLLELQGPAAEGRVRLRLTARFGQPCAVIRSPLLGRAHCPPGEGDDWLAQWAEQFLGTRPQP